MNERLEQLERALRNAHAAGDTSAARRFAAEIRRIRTDGVAASPVSQDMAAALAGGHQELSPATQARIDVNHMSDLERRHTAQTQGLGSGFFGVGTPLTAVGRMVGTALPGGDEPASFGEATEYARARREALQESNPGAFYSGVGASLVGGAGAARMAARALPKAASIFTLQRGQGVRNAARLAAAGAAGSGVTALNEAGPSAVPGAAAGGAVLAPLAVAGIAGGGAVARTVRDRFASTDNAAFRVLARRIGSTPRELQQRFQEFRETWGRAPRLAEIVNQEAAEELGQVGRVRTEAGSRLRTAAEEARLQRPIEAERVVRNRGRTDSPTAVAERLERTAEAAAAVPQAGLRTSARAVAGARDVEMDDLMQTIGQHRVFLDDDMLETLRGADVWGALPGALRRRLANAIEAGEEAGSIGLTVREWDMIRQSVSGRSGAGAGQIFRELRDQIRDYVGRAVPEYAEGLRRFGQRTDFARGVQAGRKALNQDVTEFADRLRTAGGGTPTRPRRPGTRIAERAGAGVGARTALANALTGDPAKVQRTMKRLAEDPALRANLARTLDPDELSELVRLGERYGRILDFGEGLALGSRAVGRAEPDDFREAVAVASQDAREGIRRGARTALAAAAGESPSGAVNTLERLAEDPGLRNRIVTALGLPEGDRLRRVGQTGTRAARNLEAATPAGTQAAARAAERAQETQKWIGAGVVAAGRASGAMIANIGNWIVQHTTLSRKAANRLAEMALDPNQAHRVIARMRRAGVDPDNILRMYRESAIAAGVSVGRE